jgi:hypothetical protein
MTRMRGKGDSGRPGFFVDAERLSDLGLYDIYV